MKEKPHRRGGRRRKSHRSRECTYRAEVEALPGRQSLDLKHNREESGCYFSIMEAPEDVSAKLNIVK